MLGCQGFSSNGKNAGRGTGRGAGRDAGRGTGRGAGRDAGRDAGRGAYVQILYPGLSALRRSLLTQHNCASAKIVSI